MKEARDYFKEIMKLDTAHEVRKFIAEKMRPLIPDLDDRGFYGQLHEYIRSDGYAVLKAS
jgi:hypothetical protein